MAAARSAIALSLSCLVPTLIWLAGSRYWEPEISTRGVAALWIALALAIVLGRWQPAAALRWHSEILNSVLIVLIPLPLLTALALTAAVSPECVVRGTAMLLILAGLEALGRRGLSALPTWGEALLLLTLTLKVVAALSIWRFRVIWLGWTDL
jgi:hypothetical protein